MPCRKQRHGTLFCPDRHHAYLSEINPPPCVRNGRRPSVSLRYANASCWVVSLKAREARPPAPTTHVSIPDGASRIGVDTAWTSAAAKAPCYRRCRRRPSDAHSILTTRTLSSKDLEPQDYWLWLRPLATAGPRIQEDSKPWLHHSGLASHNLRFKKERQGPYMELWISKPSGSSSKSLWFFPAASPACAGDEALSDDLRGRHLPSLANIACRNVVTMPPCENSVTAILYRFVEMKCLRANVKVSPLDVVECNSLRQVYPCWIHNAVREATRDDVNQTDFWDKVFARGWGTRALVTSVLDTVKLEDRGPPSGPVLPEPWPWKPKKVTSFRRLKLELKNGRRPLGRPCSPQRMSGNKGKPGLESILSTPTICAPHEGAWRLTIQDGGTALSKETALSARQPMDPGEQVSRLLHCFRRCLKSLLTQQVCESSAAVVWDVLPGRTAISLRRIFPETWHLTYDVFFHCQCFLYVVSSP